MQIDIELLFEESLCRADPVSMVLPISDWNGAQRVRYWRLHQSKLLWPQYELVLRLHPWSV